MLEELAQIEKGAVKKEEEELSIAYAKDNSKGADTQGSAATATSDSIKGGLGNCRQLRKRKRNNGDKELGTGMDANAQNREAAPSLLKRSHIQGSRSFASSAPATSATEAPLTRKLCESQRSQDGGGEAVMGDAQSTAANGAATNTRVCPIRGRKRKIVR